MDGTPMTSRVGSILLILVLLLPVGAVAANQDGDLAIPRDSKGLSLWEVVQWEDAPVRLTLPNHAALEQLLATVPIASFNREQIDLVYTSPKSFHLVFEPRVTPEEAQRLTDAGYDFESLPDLDRAGREETEAKWAALAAAGKAFSPSQKGTYPTQPQIGLELDHLEDSYPNLCRSFTWGQTVQGRDLNGIVISYDVNNSAAEPEVRLSSSMHGDEPVGMFLLLTLAHYLAENYGQPGYEQVTELVNTTEITILPLHNPDGYVAGNRTNANGVDLNRNFTEPAGTHPIVETENIHFSNLGFNNHFVISQNGHGGALVVNYPWDYTYNLAPDNDALIQLSLEYSTQNLPMYNGSFPQGITNGADWYVTTGCLQDWSYFMTDCMDVTIEVSNTKWPSESTLDGFWDDNRQSLLNFIAGSHYGVNGVVTGSDTGLPLDATITVIGNAMPVHTDPAHGDYYKLLPTGTFDVNYNAEGYISQTITGIATTWGTPTVQDVVLNPVATGEVTGVVTDLSETGLNAQVNFYTHPVGDYVTTVVASAALGGAYSASLVFGDYRVEAVANDYVTGVQTVTVSTTPVVADFSLGLLQEAVLFADDFEGTLAGWTGGWGFTDPADGHASANSMNDSPGANYGDNANNTMELAISLDLSGSLSGTAEFWAHWEIEDAWDGAFFEISTNGGGSWTPLGTAFTTTSSGQGGQLPGGAPVFDNNQAGWVLNTVNLEPWLDETDVLFRFRLSSDTSVGYSGFFVDDFEIMVVREEAVAPVPDTPARTVALGAWPNPFNPSTTVKFSVPTAGPVSLNVYDLQGRLVKTLAHGHFSGGDHARVWDGTTNNGSRAASGSYVVRMTAGPNQAVTKLSLVK
jgi:hypothetical protein